MIKPVCDHLLVRINHPAEDNKTQSGIILKTQSPKKQCVGEVVAVGSGRTLSNGQKLEPIVAEGNHVIFYDFAGVKVESASDSENTYLILRENDIMAIISNA